MQLHRGIGMLVAVVVAVAAPAISLAGVFTWDGGSVANSNWSAPENWNPDGTPPTDGTASLIFDGLLQTGAVNDLPDSSSFSDLGFATTAGSFTLSSNSIVLSGGITDSTPALTQSINLNIALSSAIHSIQVVGSGTLAISGVLSGSDAALTKTGPGTLTLSGANTFTGNTRVVDGSTLQLTGNGKLTSSFVNVENGTLRLGTNTLAASNPLAVNSTVTLGRGAFSGVLDLSGANPTIKSIGTSGTGINRVTNSSTVSDAVLTIQDGMSIFGGELADGSARTTGLTVSGLNSPTNLMLVGNNTYSGPTTVLGTSANPGTLTVNGAMVSPVSVQSFGVLQGTGTVGNVTLQSSTSTVRPGTAIGTLTMSGLTVNAGSLQFEVGTTNAITNKLNIHNQTSTATTTFNGGSISAVFLQTTYAAGNYSLLTSDTPILYNVQPSLDVPIIRGSATLDFTTDPKKIALNISGSPATALLWTGANGSGTIGQWRVAAGAAPFDWINGPSIPASDPNASHHFYNFDNVIFDDTATNKNVELMDDVTTGLITVDTAAQSPLNYQFFSTTGKKLLGGSILKQGAGTLTWSIDSPRIDSLTIQDGRIVLNATVSSVGTLTLGGGFTGGILDLDGHDLTVFGLAKQGSAAAAQNVITNQLVGTTARLTWVGVTSDTFAGQINDAFGKVALTMNSVNSPNGLGSLSLNAPNGFTGGVTITQGTLILGTIGALNSGTPNFVQFDTPTFGRLSLNGNSTTIAGLSSTGSGTAIVNNSSPASATLTIDGATNDTFAGSLQNGPVGLSTAPLSLVKSGTGVQTLSGANNYSGSTNITAGTLLVDGAHTGAGSYIVDLEGTLGGAGSISFTAGASLTVDGALAPGASIESLDVVGNVLFSSTSMLQIELSGSSDLVDVLNITGDIAIANGAIAQFLVTGGPTASSYVFATYTGSLSGEFLSSSVPEGYNLIQGGGKLQLVMFQVPEPGALVLAAIAFVAVVGMVRRRRDSNQS